MDSFLLTHYYARLTAILVHKLEGFNPGYFSAC